MNSSLAQNPPGRVAAITGASSGIGHALAIELANQGWRVGLIARRADKLHELASTIGETGGTAVLAEADVADRNDVFSAFESIRQQLGPIDLLVANAGLSKPDSLNPFSIDDMESMFRINTLGVLYSIGAVLPQMLSRGSGHIAAVSSSGAYKGMPGSAGYCGSKAAVFTMMEGLRIQLREHGIPVTTICPGFVRTPMTDVNKFYMPWLVEPDDAARRIIRALERKKKVYNFPWQMAVLIKGLRLLPDWFIANAMPRKSD